MKGLGRHQLAFSMFNKLFRCYLYQYGFTVNLGCLVGGFCGAGSSTAATRESRATCPSTNHTFLPGVGGVHSLGGDAYSM